MAQVEEFAHGRYGDYSGVVFYGPPTRGFWLDRLAVSDCYLHPLFYGIMDRSWQKSDSEQLPRLVSDWNTLEGWAASTGPVPVSPADAAEFAEALAQISSADIASYCAGCTVEECLRCAAILREFIISHLDRGDDLFIEDD